MLSHKKNSSKRKSNCLVYNKETKSQSFNSDNHKIILLLNVWLIFILTLQKRNIFINRSSTQTANSCKLWKVQISWFIRRIMSVKNLRYLVCGDMRATYFYTLTLGICHSWTHSFSDDTEFKFRKHTGHLNERISVVSSLSSASNPLPARLKALSEPVISFVIKFTVKNFVFIALVSFPWGLIFFWFYFFVFSSLAMALLYRNWYPIERTPT